MPKNEKVAQKGDRSDLISFLAGHTGQKPFNSSKMGQMGHKTAIFRSVSFPLEDEGDLWLR